MVKLSEQQAEWIFRQCQSFACYWSKYPPESDADWLQMAEQARDLAKRGRNHPLLNSILVQIMNYVETGGNG